MTTRCTPLFALAALGCAASSAPETAPTEWWLLDEVGDEDDDGDDDDDDDEDEDEDDEEEDLPPGTTLWGELMLADGGLSDGAVGLVVVDEAGELVCEVEYAVAGATPSEACAACSFAYLLEVGAALFAEDEDGACAAAGHLDWAGQTLGVGQANGAFHVERDGEWVEAGWSEVEGEDWSFAATLED